MWSRTDSPVQDSGDSDERYPYGLRASSADVTRTFKYTKYVTNRSANAGRHALRGITKTKGVVTEAGGKGRIGGSMR